MADAIKCITNSVIATPALKRELTEMVKDRLKQRGLDDDIKASLAIRELTADALKAAEAKKVRDIRHFWKQQELLFQMTNHPKGHEHGAYATIETDPYLAANRNGNYMNTAQVYKAVLYNAAGKDWTFLRDTWWNSTKSLFTDKSRRELNTALIDHWGGKTTSNPFAKRVADGWDRVAKETVKRIRAAGGTLAEIEGYKPQPLTTEKFYDRRLVGRNKLVVGWNEFWNDFEGAVDRSKPNPITGKPWADNELKAAANEYYNTLIFDGANKQRPNFGKGGLEVAHSINRVFNYTDDGWAKLMKKYGPDDLVGDLFRYIDNAASDIAELQTWGPRPQAQRDFITATLRRFSKNAEAERFNDMWTIASGANAAAPDVGLLNIVPATRYAAMIYQLGKVVLASMVGDHKNAAIRAIYNNASTRQYLGEVLKGIRNSQDRFAFVQEQLGVWESGYQSMHSLMKRLGETHWVTSGAGARVGKVLNASGLGVMTDANRFGIQQALEAGLAANWKKPFAQIMKGSPDLAIKMREWGVDTVWDKLRAVPLREVDGVYGKRQIVDYGKLFNVDEDAAVVMKRYVVGETRSTIISNNVHGDRLLQLHIKGGTGVGETIRTGVQYLKFPAASLYAYWKPLFAGQGTRPITRAKIAATWLTGTMVGGVLHQWAKDIANGVEPEPLTTPDGNLNYKMLARGAFAQDLIPLVGMIALRLMGWDDPQRWDERAIFGDKPLEVLADLAPATAFVRKVGKETLYDPLAAMFEGDPDKAREELAGAAKEITKVAGSWFGLNLWATGHAFGRLILDNIEQSISPDAYERRIDRQRTRMEERGQDFLWLAP